ncbi:MAG: prolyl oligopeptidase family serine peptidase [Candidatus Hydrogenedentes bacterium]|nr:prolyl oligopeptidase family serine peptidase [Candidatus Hydrogenedentota bacterium]
MDIVSTLRMASRLAVVLFCVAAVSAAAQEELPYTQQENVVYAEIHGTGLLADIYKPKGDSNGLGVIDVVCGAWHSDRGKINDHTKAQVFSIFCSKGYTVFAMRPGSVSKYTGEEMRENVLTAIRWVKSKASEYGVDPNRLGMLGASAGGHLATLAAVTPEEADPAAKDPLKHADTRVKAVAVFFPPTDLAEMIAGSPNLSETISNLLFAGGVEGHTPEEIQEKAIAISPSRQVKSGALPPFLLIHGDADPLVPLRQSELFVDAVKAAGGQAELIVKPGGAHPWPTLPEEVAVMAEWFDKQL